MLGILNVQRVKDKNKVILFGAGDIGKKALDFFGNDLVFCFCDNNKALVGKKLYGKKIVSLQTLKFFKNDFLIVISTSITNAWEIAIQLKKAGFNNFFIYKKMRMGIYQKLSSQELIKLWLDDSEALKYQRQFYDTEIKKLKKQLLYVKEHVDPKFIKPANGYLRQCQLDSVDFALNFFNTIKALDIQPFLICGSLLGAVRHHGFIPWDDLDFGLMRNEYMRLYNFCKKNYISLYNPGNAEDYFEWVDMTTRKYSNQIILYKYFDRLQISCGTSCFDRKFIDFFPFDFYGENKNFQSFNEQVKKINSIVSKKDKEIDRIVFIKEEMVRHAKILDSDHIYYGLDNMCCYWQLKDKRARNWFKKTDIFPLHKVKFDDYQFFIPNNSARILEDLYENYFSLPEDVGLQKHSWDDYKQNKLINVEFYLVDAFEISHFAPFYELLREQGLNAVFVAEDAEENTSGASWFNYSEAINLLNSNHFEYHTQCNPRAQFAFTTQDARVLGKYDANTKKIWLSYGSSLLRQSYFVSDRSILGFDYKLVHGKFDKMRCFGRMNEAKIQVVGYPRYYCHARKENMSIDELRQSLGITTNKPILCYLPTWDEHSSLQKFHLTFRTLNEKYYIITKPHHCTWRLKEKQKDMDVIHEISDLVLEPDYSLENFSQLGDITLVDAKSGAALECCFLNPNIKMIWLSPKKDIDKYFLDITFKIAKFVNNPLELAECISALIKCDPYCIERKDFIRNVFSKKSKKELIEILSKIGMRG